MELTPDQIKLLTHGVGGWFEPVGRGWRTCDSLVKRGLMEHNGAARGNGERYRTTIAGRDAIPAPEVIISTHGDPSVGINGDELRIRWRSLSSYIETPEQAEELRKSIADFFGEILDERPMVTFSTESTEPVSA